MAADPDTTRGEHLPSAREVGAYFDGLYAALAASPTHDLLSREALGDDWFGQLGYAGIGDLDRLARAVSAAPGREVLDLCCGTGGVAAWLQARTGARVTGVDCAAQALRIRQSLAHSKAALVAGDVGSLPFATASFDGAFCIDGFSYDAGAMAQDASRVLRPGGQFALLVSLAGDAQGEVRDALTDAGFEHVTFEPCQREAIPLMEAWLAGFRRHAAAHIAEVGERYHHSVTGEIERLLREYAAGSAIRAFVSAVRP